MTTDYYRPIPMTGPARPRGAARLAGGWCRFDRVEHLRRGHLPRVLPLSAVPPELYDRLTLPRPGFAGLDWSEPRTMSHGSGLHADLIEIGATSAGSSIGAEVEARQTLDLMAKTEGTASLAVATFHASVALAALEAGASLVSVLSDLIHDTAMARLLATRQVPTILRAPIDPMKDAPLLDVYDRLSEQVDAAEAAGLERDLILLDLGSGHAAGLLARVSLFHGLGCPLLIRMDNAEEGSISRAIALALAAHGQGVQISAMQDVADLAEGLQAMEPLWLGTAGQERAGHG